MFQRIEVNAEPVLKTIAFLEGETTDFDMGIWYGTPPEGSPHTCDTVCCIGGAMAVVNCIDPDEADTYALAKLMGVDFVVADALFHPFETSTDTDLHHWGITRGQAIATLQGLIDGSIGYDENSICGFGYVEAEDKAA